MAVRLYPDEILSITLYGSQARGDAKTESDIDVLVVVRRESSALRQALTDLAWQVQFEYGVVISDIIRSIEQFNRMRAKSVPVLPEHRARRRLTVEEHVRAYAGLRLEMARQTLVDVEQFTDRLERFLRDEDAL